MIRLWPLVLCFVACAPMFAGPWDRDRPDDAQLEDVLAIIAGRFDRPEPAFYEARYQRAKAQLDAQPQNSVDVSLLPVYDDAAIALMRLNRHAEAIALLDRKATKLKSLAAADARPHEKTALANLAAVLIARYRVASDRRDLELARQTIDRLLLLDEYDSDANYALREIRWLLAPPAFDADSNTPFPNLLGVTREHLRLPRGDDTLARADRAGAVVHLARRVVHGGGWEDPDVFYALSLALWLQGRDDEAIAAWLRVNELVTAGGASRVGNAPAPDAPAPDALVREMGRHLGELADLETRQELYDKIRQAADQWVNRRNDFAAVRLQQSRHPDTDADFWAGFDAPASGPTSADDSDAPINTGFVVAGIAAFFVLIAVLGGIAFFIGRRHPRPPTVDEV